jgi:hypothetical protein
VHRISEKQVRKLLLMESNLDTGVAKLAVPTIETLSSILIQNSLPYRTR